MASSDIQIKIIKCKEQFHKEHFVIVTHLESGITVTKAHQYSAVAKQSALEELDTLVALWERSII